MAEQMQHDSKAKKDFEAQIAAEKAEFERRLKEQQEELVRQKE